MIFLNLRGHIEKPHALQTEIEMIYTQVYEIA